MNYFNRIKMEFNPTNNEPFIALPPPHSNIFLTPPRITDAPAAIRILNDPLVYMYLGSPPFPYTQQSFDEWFPTASKASAEALSEYLDVVETRNGEEGGRQWVNSKIPVGSIRERNEDTGEEVFIGEIGIKKKAFLMVKDEEEKKRLMAENLALEAGDERIMWEVGC